MSNGTIEVLRRARGYVERGWRQRGYASDADGVLVSTFDDCAVCWCALGAIDRAAGSPVASTDDEEAAFVRAIGNVAIADWNDAPGRTQAEVLAAFDRAIALVEAEAE